VTKLHTSILGRFVLIVATRGRKDLSFLKGHPVDENRLLSEEACWSQV